jgi:predicted GNAT family N-acyltransferase
MDLTIELLNKNNHDRNSFDCGVGALNRFIQKQASQLQAKNISQTYVAINKNDGSALKTIEGYFSLSSGEIHCDELPPELNSKLPRYPIPIVRIGRLAVDIKAQRQGVGGFLLYRALLKILNISEQMGIYAVVVDAKKQSKSFYLSYGFSPLQDAPDTLFLPVKTIVSLI